MSGSTSRRRKRAVDEPEHENSERWMVSYADMVTLLMCLFIVMYAISQVDQKKFAELGAGLSQSFGAPMVILDSGASTAEQGTAPQPIDIQTEAGVAPMDGQTSPNPATKSSSTGNTPAAQAAIDHARAMDNQRAAASQLKSLRDIQARLDLALKKAGYESVARYRIDERGLTVSIISDKVLFESARADLQPAGRKVLDAIGATLLSLPNKLMVEGHTNQLALTPGGPYETNWELSTSRATRVLRFFSSTEGIPESRMGAAGYAAQRPIIPLSDPSSIRLNRRVDVVVLSTAPAESNALLPSMNAAADRAVTKETP
ncbi:OmpA/MotB family protein [Tessaracoccus sp.]